MNARLVRLWSRLRTSYWFVPVLLAGAAAALAATLISADVVAQAHGTAGLGHLSITGPDGARILLSTIASSAITVAALVFSITMVVLNMASAQFGPRLLRNFMSHNATQVVMGTFIGTFVYCLAVLAAVQSDAEQTFVPQSALAGGLLLGVVAFGLLIYFVHHVSIFVQAARIIDDVARNLESAIRASFPERDAGSTARTPDDEEAEDESGARGDERVQIAAARSGYVQAIDLPGLMALAREHDIMIHLECRPGHFVIENRPFAWAVPADRIDDDLGRQIAAAILTGPERTSIQDPEFAVHQLVEVALRAISPGINDPYTALNCIDRLIAALCMLAGRALPSRYVRDPQGRVRLVTDPYTYRGMVEAAFNQIRQGANGKLAVVLRLIEAIETIAHGDLPGPYRDALREQLDAIREAVHEPFAAQMDRAVFEAKMEAACAALSKK